MKRETWSKIMAIFALIGITIGVVGTGLMAILGGETSVPAEQSQKITADDLQKMIEQSNIKVSESSLDSESLSNSTGTSEKSIKNSKELLKDAIEGDKKGETLTGELSEKTETGSKK